jgi:peptide/nickel transport system ATP-binding protein
MAVLNPLLEVSNLRVSLPTSDGSVTALRGLSFTIERGQTLGLIGESGCGKSLTALAVMGLLPERAVARGSIQFDGQELLGLPDAQLRRIRGARIAMIFQEPMTALNPLHTVSHQIGEPLRLHLGLNPREAQARALDLLDKVQLPKAKERLNAYPHQLSGGQRQRVMIAMALACGPDLLIADEPTTALDVTIQKEVLTLIRNLVRSESMALLLISHNLGLMQENVGKVMVMYGGNLVESATREALFDERKHPYTQGLFACRPAMNMIKGTRLATIAGKVPELKDFSETSELSSGCAFAERCAKCVAQCRVSEPELIATGSGAEPHQVRCPRWNLQ